jgi:hypothetical protein
MAQWPDHYFESAACAPSPVPLRGTLSPKGVSAVVRLFSCFGVDIVDCQLDGQIIRSLNSSMTQWPDSPMTHCINTSAAQVAKNTRLT